MKRRLCTADIDISNGGFGFDLDIPRGGRVIRARTVFREKKLLITPRGGAPLAPVLQLVIEVDPDQPVQRRHFAILPEHMTVETTQCLEYVACADDPRTADKVVAIYEEIRIACDRKVLGEERQLEHVYNREGTDSCECGETVRDRMCDAGQHVYFPGSDWCRCGVQRSDGVTS